MKQVKLLDCTLRDGGYVNEYRSMCRSLLK